MTSMDFDKFLGGVVLEKYPQMKVDLYNPELVITVEIRVNKKAYIYSHLLECAGGLPLGSGGKGICSCREELTVLLLVI